VAQVASGAIRLHGVGTICFDLDGTLCTNTFGEYGEAEPFSWAIERVNRLAAAGHRILIFTARGTATGIDWQEVTRSQLALWGVMYDELIFGKPSADVYVDDRAVHCEAWRLGDSLDAEPGAGSATATVVIPARLASKRLARKPLVEIAGQTMVAHAHDVAVRAGCGPVLVLTDSEEVADEVRSFGGDVMMTGDHHESGTARIASIGELLSTPIVVNLQADAPLIDPDVVSEAAEQAASSRAPVTMPVYRLTREEDVRDPGVVKVVRAADGRALYCSRSPIPHVRDGGGPWVGRANFWAHAGLYAYTGDFLRAFRELPMSSLEDAERLEQLRWLEAGLRIQTFEVAPQPPSVDTPADLERVRDLFLARAGG
jgi:3-deoxy-manno-octulosonate cytidylyltransferase (CMP-KDO synthetase)